MKNFDLSVPDTKHPIPTLSLSPFTSREVDIIACLIHRRSSKAIGTLLSLSDKTVSNHICNMMSKIGCTSREGILDYVENAGYMSFLRQHYAHLNPTAFTEEQENIEKFPSSTNSLAKKSKMFWAMYVSVFLLLIGVSVFFSLQLSPKKEMEFAARSDFSLPAQSVFLDRPNLISQINQSFKENKYDIQTIALLGIGGSGKTTLVRQYAQQQSALIVWEINAETPETLNTSLESLAYFLGKSENDKKILNAFKEIKNSEERKRNFIQFIQGHFRKAQPWLLIYDNVERFADIDSFFPNDPQIWGKGKILLTTRNNTVQNNKYVQSALQIGELSENQKLNLFTKIIGENRIGGALSQEKIKAFLKEIPSFPLDVSVAAYYLKATNVSFESYLDRLNQNHKDFEKLQKNLLQEVGNYNKTRYNIITLSLRKVIEIHPDFQDLLLLIGMINSQNIPKDLLDTYKDKLIVDSFIYHLKKYSFITGESQGFSAPTFSIHRSTQKIILDNISKNINKSTINSLSNTLKRYMRAVDKEKDHQKIYWFSIHCEQFLTHKNLLSNLVLGEVSGILGELYCLLAKAEDCKKLLENSFEILKKEKPNSNIALAQTSSCLGYYYWGIGNFTKAIDFLKTSLKPKRR